MVARVVITADDAGALPVIDNAVLNLLEQGAITRASVFPNGPTFSSFISRLRDRSSALPHLSLTYGCPMGSAVAIATLLNDVGQFVQPLDFYAGDIRQAISEWCSHCYSNANVGAASQEILRQLVHFRAVVPEAGSDLTFHHDIDEAVLRLCGHMAIEPFRSGRAAAREAKRIAGYIYRFLDADSPEADAVAEVVKLINEAIRLSKEAGGLPVEVVFHPAEATETLASFTAYIAGRVSEYGALLSGEAMSLLSSARRAGSLLEFA